MLYNISVYSGYAVAVLMLATASLT